MGTQEMSTASVVFVLVNAILGALIAALAHAVPAFAALPLPSFAWLVIALFVADVAFGAFRGMHPSAALTMPVRIVALAASFGANYATTAMLAR